MWLDKNDQHGGNGRSWCVIGKNWNKSQIFSLEMFFFFFSFSLFFSMWGGWGEERDMITVYTHGRRWTPLQSTRRTHSQWWEFQHNRFWLNLKSHFLIIRANPQWNGLLYKMVNPFSLQFAKRTLISSLLIFRMFFAFLCFSFPWSLFHSL